MDFFKNIPALIEESESNFQYNLQQNPIFPFEEIKKGVYVHSLVLTRCILSAIVCVLVFITAVLTFVLIGEVNEYIVYFILIFLYFLSICLFTWKKRTYIVNLNSNTYEFYIGEDLVQQGDLRNIYIRCKAVNYGDDLRYSIVINGYNIEEETIAYPTLRKSVIAKHAKRLARRLQINYFDCNDISVDHIILHR